MRRPVPLDDHAPGHAVDEQKWAYGVGFDTSASCATASTPVAPRFEVRTRQVGADRDTRRFEGPPDGPR